MCDTTSPKDANQSYQLSSRVMLGGNEHKGVGVSVGKMMAAPLGSDFFFTTSRYYIFILSGK